MLSLSNHEHRARRISDNPGGVRAEDMVGQSRIMGGHHHQSHILIPDDIKDELLRRFMTVKVTEDGKTMALREGGDMRLEGRPRSVRRLR